MPFWQQLKVVLRTVLNIWFASITWLWNTKLATLPSQTRVCIHSQQNVFSLQVGLEDWGLSLDSYFLAMFRWWSSNQVLLSEVLCAGLPLTAWQTICSFIQAVQMPLLILATNAKWAKRITQKLSLIAYIQLQKLTHFWKLYFPLAEFPGDELLCNQSAI